MKLPQKILIVGDSGRGKSTLGRKLAEINNTELISTDDYFWKKKFTIPFPKEESVISISKKYELPVWVVEGSTRRLIEPGLASADVIIYLKFKSIFPQFKALILRNRSRSNESNKNLLGLLFWILKKRIKALFFGSEIEKIIKPYNKKVVVLDSYKKINNYVDKVM